MSHASSREPGPGIRSPRSCVAGARRLSATLGLALCLAWVQGTCLARDLVAPGPGAAGPASGAPEPRRMAITIDDLPWAEVNRVPDAEMARQFRALVRVLVDARVPAIGFVNEDKLERGGKLDPGRLRLLADWLDAGLALGNHTYGHPDLHKVPFETFRQAVIDGERETRKLLSARGQPLLWFRHPFLHTGRDEATRTALAQLLDERGYRVAPVTIDNGEWIYARAYLAAGKAGNRAGARAVLRGYPDYMDAKAVYYEDESRRLFGREIPQILLIHANALNAVALAGLIERYRARGYRFVTLEEAMTDPAYAHADAHRGAGGITWLHRWAMAQRMPREFYQGEPVVPPDVLALAGVDGE